MQITINNSSDLSDLTQRVITEKVQKLETYYDRIERAEVFIKDDDGSTANGHTVDIRLAIPGNDVFATHTDESIERATAEVTEALRRQLKKHKEKNNSYQQP